jgi:hypothetical protein
MMLAEKEITVPDKSDKVYHDFVRVVTDLQAAAEACEEAKYPKLDALYELHGDYERARLKMNHHYLHQISAQRRPEVFAYCRALNDGNAASARAKAAYTKRGSKWPGVREG